MSKKFLKSQIEPNGRSAYQNVMEELEILKTLKHPNVINLKSIIECNKRDHLYLVTDWYIKGTIEDMVEKKKGPLLTHQSRAYFRDMLKAVFYCHKVANVIHRDIKPANIVIDHYDSAVLIDFGISSIKQDDDILKHAGGSPLYYAPEMFKKSQDKDIVLHGEKTDVWALGVTLYYMTQGKTPFD